MSIFFKDFVEFAHMGGYARYVWPAYFVAFSLLLLNVYLPSLKHRKLLRKLPRYTSARDKHAPSS